MQRAHVCISIGRPSLHWYRVCGIACGCFLTPASTAPPRPARPPPPLFLTNPFFSRFISYPRTETEIFKEGTNLQELIELQTGHHMWGPFAQRLAAVSCAVDDAGPACALSRTCVLSSQCAALVPQIVAAAIMCDVNASHAPCCAPRAPSVPRATARRTTTRTRPSTPPSAPRWMRWVALLMGTNFD